MDRSVASRGMARRFGPALTGVVAAVALSSASAGAEGKNPVPRTAGSSGAISSSVIRFEVEKRTPVADGRSFGEAGPYERLDGRAWLEIDPADPLNKGIVNLDKAPRNARGMVAYDTPFRILKPVDMRRGNRKLWYGINNRGIGIEMMVHELRPSKPGAALTESNPETNVLMVQGYAIVDAGWHGDGRLPAPAGSDMLFPNFPIAREADGRPTTGPLRLEFSSDVPSAKTVFTKGLGDSGLASWRPYEAADTDTRKSTLTVRDRPHAAPRPIASDRWAFGTCETGRASLVPGRADICLFDGFSTGKVYELIYPATNATVMGLGYAVTRDIGSFLRYRTHDAAGNRNPLAIGDTETGLRQAYASSTSSTSMYLRDFLYLGFNEDLAHRRLFDAVSIYSGGSYRLFANTQFAHPTLFSRQEANQDFTANSVAPFTFAVTTDPVSGVRDGILKRPKTDPLVIQIDEEETFWQWKASLNVVDGRGRPVPVPDNVRLYVQNGFGHVGAAGLAAPALPADTCRDARSNQPATISFTPRAMARVLDDWADRGIAPPKSNYPRIEDGTLVTLDAYRRLFPKVPGFAPPEVMNTLDVLDFGPRFGAEGGVQTRLPPRHGSGYRLWVPRPGKDGTGVAGIDTIWTRVPLGTNVGWNVRGGSLAPDLCFLNGSFKPFARTRRERVATGDPRPSLEERYTDHAGFVRAVRKASADLVAERFLLPEDAALLIEAAERSDVLR